MLTFMNEEASKQLEFPNTLNSYERRMVHKCAEEYSLISKS